MATDIQGWESWIVEQLQPLVSQGYRVEPYLDQQGRPHGRGQVIIAYRRSRFSAPPGSNVRPTTLTQSQQIEFEIVLQLCDLRSHQGAYPMLNQIRDLLSGSAPTPLDRTIFQTEEENLGQSEGIWSFSMIFQTLSHYQKRGR